MSMRGSTRPPPTTSVRCWSLSSSTPTPGSAWRRNALAHCVASGTAFLDLDAVVLDGSFCRPLLQSLIEHTALALKNYNWEGMWPATVIAGSTGPDARALGGAWLPLHANFAPHRDLFLKVSN